MKFSSKVCVLEDGVKEVLIRDDDSKPLVLKLKNAKVVSINEGEVLLNVVDERVSVYEKEVLAKAKETKGDWFGNENISDSRLDNAFVASYSDEGEFKLQCSPVVRIYDSKNNLVERSLEAGDVVEVAVQLKSVQFLKKSFDTNWLIHQAKLMPAPKPKKVNVFDECLFDNEESTSESDEEDFF